MQLDQYEKPKNIPSWVEKILFSQQRNRFNNFGQHYYETLIIKEFYTANACNTFIDMGCWLGVLSARVKKYVDPSRLILIDAIPTYLHVAKQLLVQENFSSNVEIFEMSVIDTPTFPKFMTVDLNNTMDSSSIKYAQPESDKTINLPIANPKTCKDAAIEIFNLAPNSAYLKMDIDGVDYSFLQALLNINYFPSVIQFEAWLFHPDYLTNCISILEQFSAVGYKVPSPDELTNLKVCNIIISRQAYKTHRLK